MTLSVVFSLAVERTSLLDDHGRLFDRIHLSSHFNDPHPLLDGPVLDGVLRGLVGTMPMDSDGRFTKEVCCSMLAILQAIGVGCGCGISLLHVGFPLVSLRSPTNCSRRGRPSTAVICRRPTLGAAATTECPATRTTASSSSCPRWSTSPTCSTPSRPKYGTSSPSSRRRPRVSPPVDWLLLFCFVFVVQVVSRLAQLYKKPGDVDLYLAGMLERRLAGSLLGHTFTHMVADQFARLKAGDRYYYEAGGQTSSFTLRKSQTVSFCLLFVFLFVLAPLISPSRLDGFVVGCPAQLDEIRRTSMAALLCRNGDDIRHIQPLTFRPVSAV